ncbi:MAG: hypothetical protein COC12_08530 [Rhodobacteraceae bacterium]|nr:MAG: hypothetical protein COC12_08530 [Paracoccaceae bacterium]
MLDIDAPKKTPDELTKSAYARRHDLTNGRISQMLGQGLPVLDNGRIPVEAADAWITANINRRASNSKDVTSKLSKVKQEREEANRDLLRLQLAEKQSRLIDRKQAEVATFERARAERDRHLAWVSRVAPVLASALNAELRDVYAILDREMRDHLRDLADTPIGDLQND